MLNLCIFPEAERGFQLRSFNRVKNNAYAPFALMPACAGFLPVPFSAQCCFMRKYRRRWIPLPQSRTGSDCKMSRNKALDLNYKLREYSRDAG